MDIHFVTNCSESGIETVSISWHSLRELVRRTPKTLYQLYNRKVNERVLNLDISVILLALITAFIGYQFSLRTKKKERFLKELSNSYNEIYFPLVEILQTIIKTENKEEKIKLLDGLFNKYSNPESKIRFIASSSILEFFYEFKEIYFKYKNEKTRKNEIQLMEKLHGFYYMIEDEYWDAHDIIYEDHVQFREDTFMNPFLVILFDIFRVFYYLTTFLLGISFFILYIAIWNKYFPLKSIPTDLNVVNAILIVLFITMIYGLMLLVKTFAIKKNRRKSKIINKLIARFFYKTE